MLEWSLGRFDVVAVATNRSLALLGRELLTAGGDRVDGFAADPSLPNSHQPVIALRERNEPAILQGRGCQRGVVDIGGAASLPQRESRGLDQVAEPFGVNAVEHAIRGPDELADGRALFRARGSGDRVGVGRGPLGGVAAVLRGGGVGLGHGAGFLSGVVIEVNNVSSSAGATSLPVR